MSRSRRTPLAERDAVRSGPWTVANATLCLATLLVVLRWLIPAEAAAHGGQLGIAAAWCALGGFWLWTLPLPRRVTGLVDVAVALLVGGHLAGGFVVFLTGGQLRTAANLMAEWVGLGCAWIVLRDVVVAPAWAGELRRAVLATAATVALLGVWQHYVSLPQSAREFAPKIERLRAAQARGEHSPVAWELARLGVPTTEPGLTLYEKRLRDSREPFGCFALANTLGGLLAASLVWGLAAAMSAGSREEWKRIAWRAGPPLLVVAWCLALTKSRTAWVGAFCGLSVLAWRWLRRRRAAAGSVSVASHRWLFAAIGVVAMAAAVWGLVQSGAWDAEVLTEASKSLGYRRQYWAATLTLVAESPLAGRGLGQFREHYLRVKLPEASEEIADPHNALLDAWVNGGAGAALGLLGLIVCVLLAKPGRSEVPTSASRAAQDLLPSNEWAANGVFIGGVAAFAVAWASGWLAHNNWDDKYFVLAAVWCAGFVALRPTVAAPVEGAAALATLGVHLLGAGGLGMPAVVQTGWLWLAIATDRQDAEPFNPRQQPRRIAGFVALAAGLLIALAVWRPVLIAERQMERGDLAALRGDVRGAEIEYLQASEVDRWNPNAPGRLAELRFNEWRQLDPRGEHYAAGTGGLFPEAVEFLQTAQRRDPLSVVWPRRMAELWMALHERTSDRADAERAAELLRHVVPRYETNAALLAELSDAAAAAGSRADASEAARRALIQDDVNQRLGHVERVLPADVRHRLERRGREPQRQP